MARKNNQDIVMGVLAETARPMTAYQILEKLTQHGIKGPPTVYRALDTLQQQGLVHRLESINAFVMCQHQGKKTHHSSFVLCTDCGGLEEICDDRMEMILKEWSEKLGFLVIQQTTELLGLCLQCKNQRKQKSV